MFVYARILFIRNLVYHSYIYESTINYSTTTVLFPE